MRLHTIGGFCNRLRAILSYRVVHGRSITVVWKPDEYVSHARWSDVLEPLDGVTFVDAGPWDLESFFVCPQASANRDWEQAYREVRPTQEVASAIDRMQSKLGAYAACHVRRTDHVPNTSTHGGRVDAAEVFVRWSEEWPDLDFWLATDNGVTQDQVRRLRSESGRAHPLWYAPLDGAEIQVHDDHRRNGSLQHAVIDLMMCAGATHFRGSHGSSFSETIAALRRVRLDQV